MKNKFYAIPHISEWLFSSICLLIAAILSLAARYTDGFAQWYAVHIYPFLRDPAARFFSIWNGSVSEIIILFLIFFTTFFALASITVILLKWRKGRMFVSAGIRYWICSFAFLIMIYSLNCSVNYQRDGIGTILQLPTKSASKENMIKLSLVLADEIKDLTEDHDWEYSILTDRDDVRMRSEAITTMKRFGEREPTLSGYYPEPKPVHFSSFLSIAGIEGIFSPITMEANYNREMTSFLIPYAMCHELAHLKGYMKEEDAGLIAYLACRNSPYPVFRYSGIFHALIFTLNELKTEATPEEFDEIYAKLPKQVRYQLYYVKERNLAERSSAASAANFANDLYLKANAQSGIKSYDSIVDLLICEYADQIDKENLI